jgi:hypothetical protein
MRRRSGNGWSISEVNEDKEVVTALVFSAGRRYNRSIVITLGGNTNMKVYDSVKKEEVEVNGTKGLIDIMRDGRQVDLYLKEKKSDADGYMSWDVEHWSSIDVKRFIRCYSLEGRVLGESTGHNIYDLENEFKPEEAAKIELS